ncbi:MAG: helix-turn-helix domain-containing protein [Thiotrichaceae bacterium]
MTAQMIKLLRTEMGKSQKEFATLIGYSYHSVRSWEQSLRKPSKRAVTAIRSINI